MAVALNGEYTVPAETAASPGEVIRSAPYNAFVNSVDEAFAAYNDFRPRAFGNLTNRALYNDRPEGFEYLVDGVTLYKREGAAGRWVLAGGSIGVVETVTQLATSSKTLNDQRVISRNAYFDWNPADLETEVSGDPNKVFYVAPSTATSGASGAYVLRFADKKVTSENCGMVSSATVDQHAKMSKVIEYINAGEIDEFTFGSGVFQFSDTLPDITASDFIIQGLNRGATLLRLDDTINTHKGRLFYVNGNASVVRRPVIRDFSIDCQSGTDQTRQFFKIDGVTYGVIERLFVGVGVAGVIAAGLPGSETVGQLELREIQGSYMGGDVIPWDFGNCQVTTMSRVQVTANAASTVPTIRIRPGDGETADTFRIENCAIYCRDGQPQNCLIDITDGSMTNFWMNNTTFDRAIDNNIWIRDGGSTDSRWCRNIWLTNNFLTMLRQDEGGTTGPAFFISQGGSANSRINDVHLIGNLITYDEGPAMRVTRTGAGEVTGVKVIGNAVKQMATSGTQTPTAAMFDMGAGDFSIIGNSIGPRFHSSFLRTNYLVRTTADVANFKVIGNNDTGVLQGTMFHNAYAAVDDSRQVLGNSSALGSMAAVGSQRVKSIGYDLSVATIDASGVVSAAGASRLRVTSNSGVTDDLDDITGGRDGQRVLLSVPTGHTITVLHATDKIRLSDSTNKVLGFADRLELEYSDSAGAWVQISYSDNG